MYKNIIFNKLVQFIGRVILHCKQVRTFQPIDST